MAYTFKGGVWPDDHKYTKNIPIEEIAPVAKVSVSLSQHVGIMCKPVVKVGEQVRVGQMIGDVPGGLGCPVHASVSGTVVQIEEVTAQRGGTSYNIVIENDGQNMLDDTVQPFGKKLQKQLLKRSLLQCGLQESQEWVRRPFPLMQNLRQRQEEQTL